MNSNDIAATADFFVDQYGDRAADIALERAKEALVRGDDAGQDQWIRVLRRVRFMQSGFSWVRANLPAGIRRPLSAPRPTVPGRASPRLLHA